MAKIELINLCESPVWPECYFAWGSIDKAVFFDALRKKALLTSMNVRHLEERGDFRYMFLNVPRKRKRKGILSSTDLDRKRGKISERVTVIFLETAFCMHCGMRPSIRKPEIMYCTECLRWYQHEESPHKKHHGMYPDPAGYDGDEKGYLAELKRRGLKPATMAELGFTESGGKVKK